MHRFSIVAALAVVSAAVLGASCFPPADTSVLTDPESGGITTSSGALPSSTQPADIAGPRYRFSQLDPLFEATAGAKALRIVDIDGDGLNDVVSISSESQSAQIHLRNALTRLFETTVIAGGAPLSTMTDVEVADFNQDLRPDLAVLVEDTGYAPPSGVSKIGALVLLFQGADATNVNQWTQITLAFTENDTGGLTDLAVGDFDGVNGSDVLILSNEVAEDQGDPDTYARLFFNPGAALATTAAAWLDAEIDADIADMASADVRDIDQDGDWDAVIGVPSAASFNIRWLENPLAPDGVDAARAGNWTPHMIGQQAGGADAVAIGDIDEDGDLDAAVAHTAFGLVQWFRNPGAEALRLETRPVPWEVFNIGTIGDSAAINQLQLLDIDGDGHLQCFVTASGEACGFKRQEDVEDYWARYTIFNTDPVAVIGIIDIDDLNDDGLLDFVAPLDRDGLTRDQFVLFTREP